MTDLDDVIATLLDLMRGSESDTARISAAKILLERLAPKSDEEAAAREREEREAALTEAKILLAEFTTAKLAGLQQPDALAADGAAAADNARPAIELADLADSGGQGLGQDPHGG